MSGTQKTGTGRSAEFVDSASVASSIVEAASVAIAGDNAFHNLVASTPAAGTYLVWGSSTGISGGAGVTAQIDIAVAGVQQGQSVKSQIAEQVNNQVFLFGVPMARVTVNGSQQIQYRARQNTGAPINWLNNQMVLLKVG